jgi:hypothetical protein
MGGLLAEQVSPKVTKKNQKLEKETSLHPEFLVKFTELFCCSA